MSFLFFWKNALKIKAAVHRNTFFFKRECPLFPFLHFRRMQTKREGNETHGAKLWEGWRHGNLWIKDINYKVVASKISQNALDLMISVRLLLRHSWKPICFQRDLKKRQKEKGRVTKYQGKRLLGCGWMWIKMGHKRICVVKGRVFTSTARYIIGLPPSLLDPYCKHSVWTVTGDKDGRSFHFQKWGQARCNI